MSFELCSLQTTMMVEGVGHLLYATKILGFRIYPRDLRTPSLRLLGPKTIL